MRNELYMIFRNALKEAFDRHPYSDICLGEIQEIVGNVFENMLKDGELDDICQED